METKLKHYVIYAMILSFFACSKQTPQKQAPFVISNAIAYATAPGQTNSVLYFDLLNQSNQDINQIDIQNESIETINFHQTVMDNDTMQMRKAGQLQLQPGKTLQLKPGGMHVMLMGLEAPLVVGSTLQFSVCVVGFCEQISAKVVHPIEQVEHHH